MITANPNNDPGVHIRKQQPRDSKRMRFRPSYTPESASEWKPIFDSMIADNLNKEVSSAITGYSANTLAVKCNDALAWLSDYDADKIKYMKLRKDISVTKREEGIILYFKRSSAERLLQAASTIGETGGVIARSWRDSLQEWLATAQSDQVWDSIKEWPHGIVITAADREWLLKVFAPLEGAEMDLGDTSLRVMR